MKDMPYIKENNRHIAKATRLPVSEIMKTEYEGVSLAVKTPHKGEVIIELKRRSYTLFGSLNESEKTTQEIVSELLLLEEESKEFLLDKWLTQGWGMI